MKAFELTPELERQVALLMARARVPASLYPDAKQAVYLALVLAWERFDPARGLQFTTYAGWKIRGAIYDWMRREDPLTRSDRKRVKRGDMPAPECDLTVDQLARICPALDRTPEEVAISQQVREWLCLLTGKERRVIEAYYFEERTLAEIATELRLHLSRTAALRVQAIARLRACLQLDRPKTLSAAA